MSPTKKPTFPTLLETYHRDAYTGPMLLQWNNGRVLCVEIPQPSVRIPLDSKPERAAPLRRTEP